MAIKLTVNGKTHDVEASPDTPLLWIIRNDLGMTGTKFGCGLAQCGACSVLVNGQLVRSCVTPIDCLAEAEITTIEDNPVGERVVAAQVRNQVPQCGSCQSGQVMVATALLKAKANPSQQDIDATMVNLCRCGTYNFIKTAVAEISGNGEDAL